MSESTLVITELPVGDKRAVTVPIMESFSSTNVTEISRQQLQDELFSGFEQAEKPCDCSCAGIEKLQTISKLPEEEQEKHPEALGLAMCMPKCLSRWRQCGK